MILCTSSQEHIKMVNSNIHERTYYHKETLYIHHSVTSTQQESSLIHKKMSHKIPYRYPYAKNNSTKTTTEA